LLAEKHVVGLYVSMDYVLRVEEMQA